MPWLLKGLTEGKLSNCMPKCWGCSIKQMNMFVFSPKILRSLRDIEVLSIWDYEVIWTAIFILPNWFYGGQFTVWTTSACYRLGYCYVLVDRVYKPKCEETTIEISPMLRQRDLFLDNCQLCNIIFSQRGNWGCFDLCFDEFPWLAPNLAISPQTWC